MTLPPPSPRFSGLKKSTVFLSIFVVGLIALSQWEQTGLTEATTSKQQQQQQQQKNVPKKKTKKLYTGKVKQISIVGERNSGTRWTMRHLTDCFGHEIKVTTTFTRYKHWFQYPGYDRYPHDTLVVAQFRNPYDWFKAMQHVPHHMPNHLQYREDEKWKEFLTSEWTMERIGSDRWNNLTEPCQEHFAYKDIISCPVEPLPHEAYPDKILYSAHQPFYEMRNDGSGKPYKNIMEMRSDKIRNFMTIADYPGVADVWITQYEYLLAKGTHEMIDDVSKWTGIKPNCTAYPPQQRESRHVEQGMAEYLKTHLNWTVEAMVGYGPHKTIEVSK